MSASPRPWNVASMTMPSGRLRFDLYAADGSAVTYRFGSGDDNDQANADLIVRAVNEREGLLDALTSIESELRGAMKAYDRGDDLELFNCLTGMKRALDRVQQETR